MASGDRRGPPRASACAVRLPTDPRAPRAPALRRRGDGAVGADRQPGQRVGERIGVAGIVSTPSTPWRRATAGRQGRRHHRQPRRHVLENLQRRPVEAESQAADAGRRRTAPRRRRPPPTPSASARARRAPVNTMASNPRAALLGTRRARARRRSGPPVRRRRPSRSSRIASTSWVAPCQARNAPAKTAVMPPAAGATGTAPSRRAWNRRCRRPIRSRAPGRRHPVGQDLSRSA